MRVSARVVGLWAVSRLIFATVFVVSPHLPWGPGEAPRNFRDAVLAWDANWLLGIAGDGYVKPAQAAFFPGFPRLISGLAALGLDPLWASLLVNSLLSLAAVLMMVQVVRRDHNERVALVAVAIVLFHPLSFFLLVPYTEALFLAMVVVTFAAARAGQWWWTAIAAGIATLTRNSGVFLVFSIVYLSSRWWRSEGEGPHDRWRDVGQGIAILAPVVALSGYMVFTDVRFGDPLLFINAQEYWSGHLDPAAPFSALWREMFRIKAWAGHHLPMSLLGLWLTWRVVKAREMGYALFVVPSVLLSFSLSKLAITPRLHLVLFPIWIEAARLYVPLPRWLRVLIAGIVIMAGIWFALSFSRGEWVA